MSLDKIDPADMPELDEVGPPRISQIRFPGWLKVGAAVVVVAGAAGGVAAMRGNSSAAGERFSLSKPKTVQPASIPELADKPARIEPPPMQDPMKAITLTASQAAEMRGEWPAAAVDPDDCTSDALTPQQAVECERRHGGGESKSALLLGAERSDKNVSAHRGKGHWSGDSDGPTAATKHDREADDGDEDSAYVPMPAWPARKGVLSESTGLQPPPPALGGLGGLQSTLAGLQGQQTALAALAAHQQSQDPEDQRESFNGKGGIDSIGGDTLDMGDCDIGAGRPVKGNMTVATNSDLPSGNTVCIDVSATVYCGGERQHIAIPQGSRMCGDVNQRVSYGAERQQLCMRQLERPPSAGHPNGDRTPLGCLIVSDIQGAPGMPADVDNHWGQVITGSLLSAILGMGPSALAGNQQAYAPSVVQGAAAQAGTNLNQAGQRIVQRELQRKPTLTTKILEGVTVLFTGNKELPLWRARGVTRPRLRRITWIKR